MLQPAASPTSSRLNSRPPEPPPRLRGRGLLVARGVWLVLALAFFANFLASIPAYYGILRTTCPAPDPNACASGQLTAALVATLHQLGFSLSAYAAYSIGVDVAVSLVYWIVGLLIFWRKSDEWLGLLVSFVLVLFGFSGITDTLAFAWLGPSSDSFFTIADLLGQLPGLLQWAGLGLFLVTFPTGRVAPRWTWLVACLWVLQFFAFDLGSLLGDTAQGALLGILVPLTYGSTALVLIYRYRRVFTLVQRQQTKWVVFGVGTGVLILLCATLLTLVFPALGAPDAPYQLLSGLFGAWLFLSIPLSVGIAILRYRLWDIDAIINKALVYGSLTALLGALYAGLIIGLISLASALTGTTTEEPVALVVATLIIAALVHPVRHRIQSIIDQRFYRKKYNAEQTLAAFSATLRNEVDLEQIRAQVLSVVQETMQPGHVSLWLRPPEERPAQQAHSLEPRRQAPTKPNTA